MTTRFYVGSYAERSEQGIALCELDGERKRISVLARYGGVKNPIYFARHPKMPILYSCAEKEDGEAAVAAWRIGENGALTLAGITGDGGKGCCHVCVNADGTALAASNYGDGSLSLFRIEGDGTVLSLSDRKVHKGKSVHWRRQQEAHVHFAAFAGQELFSCDLGEDRIWHYRLGERGILTEQAPQYHTAAGDGPRHLVLDRDRKRIYCITEMGANVTVIDAKTGRNLQRLRSIPEEVDLRSLPVGDFDAYGAAIRMTEDGERVLASNRGDDSISVFAVGARGILHRLSTQKTGGVMPRDVILAGDTVLAAHQVSGTVTALAWNAERTALERTQAELSFPRAVALLLA